MKYIQLSSRAHKSFASDIAICLLLGLVSFLAYNANLRTIPAADTYAARYMPFSIWRNHTVTLDPIVDLVAQGSRLSKSMEDVNSAWWVRTGREGHLVSLYPIIVPLVVAPLYLPAVAYLHARDWDPLLVDHAARIMEKLCASLLATTSVMLLYFLLRRRAEPAVAALLTVAFALGTTTWVISSQALWMHGLAQVLIISTLLLLTGPCSPVRAATVGFLCALIACNRQPDTILAAGFGLYGLRWAGRMFPVLVAAALLPIGLLLLYNLVIVGHIVGGYGLVVGPYRTINWKGISEHFGGNIPTGFAGLLFSPTRGLFVFSPFLLFVVFYLPSVLRERSTYLLSVMIGCAVLAQVIFYGSADWRQGASFGPRWLTDMLPILVWMLPPIVAALSSAARVAFGTACIFAIAIQTVGAFWYTGASDAALFASEGSEKMRASWDIRNAPFIAELKHPRAPADLFVRPQGNVDIVSVRDEEDDLGRRQIEVHGWTLTNGRTPTEVAVRIDGQIMGSSGSFFERPDVVIALGAKSPSGWQITFSAQHLSLGEHVVTVLARPHGGGELRLLQQRTFTVTANSEVDRRDRELANAAQKAGKKLAERQQGLGYWLTAFTDDVRFEQARQEMNTFTNAIIVDVVGPVADKAAVASVLGRARTFLAGQIEEGGLVRYHGRPDAPMMGVLGCRITPDADDTALVWRVAPSANSELRLMALATMAQFRTVDGLYRTWLAPRERYECIDPGSDPNPADIAIQIHVLMLLAEVDPPAARALCDELQKRTDDDKIWVYYKMTPLIPVLRLPDLQKLGCALQMPVARLQMTVPGQEIWLEAVQRLQQADSAEGQETAYSETAEFLRKLADSDFSLLARNPPFLYHNDLSATVRRFYWSEELGYAIWLRLYFQNKGARP